ncbi:MAG: DUF896 domain-containing protein [Fusobacteriaceae bacterium]|jgi:uncharacterized protein YnzC (UPF0291/DUF896 family)|nr:DUF896 domain-containing protein [Fusobacteriaceae bacterium]
MNNNKKYISTDTLSMEELIKKINEYTRLSRERQLTIEERKDREALRRIYVERFKSQVRNHLDSIKFVEENEKIIIN